VRGRGLRGGAVRRGVHLQRGAKLGEAQEPPKTAGSAWGRADRLWRCSSGQAEEEAALQSTGGKEQQGEENVGGGEENEHRAGSGLPRIERPIRALSWGQATGVRMAKSGSGGLTGY
jgi:hypothetical protein